MEGMRGSGNRSDVTHSLPLEQMGKKRELSGSTVTHADVNQSLRSQLRPALFNRKALDKFKVTHSLDSDLQLSEKFAAVEDRQLDEAEFLAFHEDQLAQMVMKTIDIAYSKATGQETYKLVPSNQPDSPQRGHQVETFDDKGVAPHLVPGRRRRGLPATSDIMTAVGKASRPYHQAMEISLGDPVSFCAEIADVNDPRVMQALRVCIEKEQCSQPMQANWDKRMKDIICEYQTRQILLCLDSQITADLEDRFAFERVGVPVDPEAHDSYAAKLTVVYGEKMIKEITQGIMNYPGITRGANADMAKV